MKLSKSKLALAKVINENGGWPERALWAVQDNCIAFFRGEKPEYKSGDRCWYSNSIDGACVGTITCDEKVTNWHQTILSREEYYQAYPKADDDGWIEWNGGECPVSGDDIVDVAYSTYGAKSFSAAANSLRWSKRGLGGDIIAYRLHKPEVKPEFCESVMRSIPEPELDDSESRLAKALELVKMAAPHLLSDKYKFNGDEVMGERKPTIEQLAADYRNAKGYADRKQDEADKANMESDAALSQLEDAIAAIGFVITPLAATEKEPELVITDWRQLKVGDLVEITTTRDGVNIGEAATIIAIDENNEDFRVTVTFPEDKYPLEYSYERPPTTWRFIRRP